MEKAILEVRNLKKYFPIKSGILSRTKAYVYAVDDISFYLKPGETLAIVGESGCGKTTAARAILRLIEPTAGQIFFQGVNLTALKKKALRPLRKEMQIIFQDPYASLNPRMKVEEIVGEPFDIHRICKGSEKRERVASLLSKVGLSPEHMKRYPHEFSGGQRQRIGIARALALNPKLIIADEPVSALDVSIQAQVINLLSDLQEEFGLSYLLIAHDLRLVEYIADRVAVMYLGRLVEFGLKKDIFENPLHPYTKALLSAVPIPDPKVRRKRIILTGDVPSPLNPPSGCYFHPRCPYRQPESETSYPELKDAGKEHWVACHLV